MTIPFGRHRLILTLAVTTMRRPVDEAPIPLGLDDRDLARWSRTAAIDIDRARWEGLSLVYGGNVRP